MRKIIEERGPDVVRIEAIHCMDMIASQAEREKIAQELAGGLILLSNAPELIEVIRRVGSSDDPHELLQDHGTCFGCIK